MPPPTHSVMAERVAVARAAHQLMDAQPLIFEDPLALRIVGSEAARALKENRTRQQAEWVRRSRAAISVRSRFAEEELARSLAAGACQYVILGAGLDTFAYRRTELAGALQVFEVDQPGTQAWKRQRLADAGIAVPPNLRFVPVDFNERTLADGLAEAGFRRDLPAVFSWLGVLYYLPRASVSDTLRYLGSQAAACTVVFDFAVAEPAVHPDYLHLFHEFRRYNENAGEPWLSWFTPEEIRALLRDCGFTDIVHLDFQEIGRRYLEGRPDALLTGPLVALVSARK